MIAAVTLDALGELVRRNVIDQLREDDAANIHASAWPTSKSGPHCHLWYETVQFTSSES
jgi:hypothetical protein